ncbi:hypothetical protein E1287_38865 [Actinomadura sp. KC06]|uniref:hypothetical protein n=1 Tax=Actinomadura sp. KC06 TaxID=2530369 RepID=UPI001049FD98|nr:hypothetical protein [Actinomadura sp. KC06]TDD23583.1 hypothetical protein E1287_38865 [Actinomadura sp. KC06]
MNPAQHLDAVHPLHALAAELAATGWSVHLEDPDLLHAVPPDSARPGTTVRIKDGVGGVPWFVTSTGDPLRPCHDLTGAGREIRAQPVPQESRRSGHALLRVKSALRRINLALWRLA